MNSFFRNIFIDHFLFLVVVAARWNELVLSGPLNFQRTTSLGYFKNLKEVVVYMKESMVLWPVQ
jgi:hypothetical protein